MQVVISILGALLKTEGVGTLVHGWIQTLFVWYIDQQTTANAAAIHKAAEMALKATNENERKHALLLWKNALSRRAFK